MKGNLVGILVKTVSGWGNVWEFSIWWIGEGEVGKVGNLLGVGSLGMDLGDCGWRRWLKRG